MNMPVVVKIALQAFSSMRLPLRLSCQQERLIGGRSTLQVRLERLYRSIGANSMSKVAFTTQLNQHKPVAEAKENDLLCSGTNVTLPQKLPLIRGDQLRALIPLCQKMLHQGWKVLV